MNVGSALKSAKTLIDTLDAELLMLRAIKKDDRSFLVAHEDYELDDEAEKNFAWMVERRANGEPLAYILGEKEFYGRKFVVSPNVLIPRPESEDIVDIVKNLDAKKILDVGTGSGCLAVSIALEKQNAFVTAVDICEKALIIAKHNAKKFGAKIKFAQSNLLDRVNENFDAIVANLPYVDISWPWKGKELDWEPRVALYASDAGLDLVKKMIEQAQGRTKYLVLECDPCQHEIVKKYAGSFGFQHIETRNFILVFRVSA